MARSYLIFAALLLFSSLLTAKSDNQFSRSIPPSSLGIGNEKLTHLHFYFHDIVAGSNITTVQVAQASSRNFTTGFGNVAVADNPLTMEPEMNSALVGRAQGMYALTSQSEPVMMMMANFAFTQGTYNGSTITVMGRNPFLTAVREMPIVGGSGVFRFARGYVEARTFSFNATARVATVEYNAYVIHY